MIKIDEEPVNIYNPPKFGGPQQDLKKEEVLDSGFGDRYNDEVNLNIYYF